MPEVEIPGTKELQNGQMKKFNTGKQEILLARVNDKFYASDNRCRHMGGNLSAGKLEKTIVTCPLHHSQYDLVDGHVVRWTDWSGIKLSLSKIFKPPSPLKTYKVRMEGDKVFVEI
jgi:3-phenylpropionate/trans-cinnamate dioxygenase ferredoxin component